MTPIATVIAATLWGTADVPAGLSCSTTVFPDWPDHRVTECAQVVAGRAVQVEYSYDFNQLSFVRIKFRGCDAIKFSGDKEVEVRVAGCAVEVTHKALAKAHTKRYAED